MCAYVKLKMFSLLVKQQQTELKYFTDGEKMNGQTCMLLKQIAGCIW